MTQHQIEFVIVGGVAVSAHGSSYLTFDLDVCYARTRENLKRIVAALAPYHPRPRDFPDALPFVWDEQTLRQGTNFTFATDLGNIDLLGEVAGLGSYNEVREASVVLSLFGFQCQVLSLDALIIAKRAAGRTKDLLVLPELEALREVLQKTED
ncbi:MAG TPA: hypothetical protein VJT82_10625 [Pyrinomonadaceae bacterium]|nr:hypothetical protein [Pyrinomonadaceae bacterium]